MPELGAYNSLSHFKLFWKEGGEQGIVFKMLECSYLGETTVLASHPDSFHTQREEMRLGTKLTYLRLAARTQL